MIKDDATLMFENYKRLIVYLTEKKDKKGLEILYEIIKNTDMLVSGLFELHEKVIFQIKEGGKED